MLVTLLAVLIGLIGGYFLCLHRAYVFKTVKYLMRRLFPHTQYSARHISAHLHSLFETPNTKADNTFIRAVPLAPQTVDVHFMMGRLLRSQGDTAQAITVHQNLAISSLLNTDLHSEAQLALADDYLQAGMLDRAEIIYKNLSEQSVVSVMYKAACLQKLRHLYEKMQDWPLAIDAVESLKKLHDGHTDNMTHYQVNYSCEMALQALELGNIDAAKENIIMAKHIDATHPRIQVLELMLGLHHKHIQDVFSALEVARLGSMLSFEQGLSACVKAFTNQYHLDSKPVLLLLEKLNGWYTDQPSLIVLYYRIRLSRFLSEQHVLTNQAQELLFKNVIAAIQTHQLFELYAPFISVFSLTELCSSERTSLAPMLFEQVVLQLDKNLFFECTACGYSQHDSQWQCPACQAWDTFTPNHI